ncbi:GTPase, G3E family [Rhizobiales bacterium GAS113]|nr:GTPase, G3E family [Rhizobiales bacterium GAS113]
MLEAVAGFTPVNLITGFLGSGKTTLLGRLLRDSALADTAVLINEFGEVGLDHHLMERIDDTVVLLQSGCLCCTIRGELSEAIKVLHSKRERGVVPPFRRLVIESTGLADPFPILSTVHADPVLKHHFRLGAVITTVDAVNGMAELDAQPESVKQVAVADRLVLTKTDLAEPRAALALTERLRALNPAAPLWRAAEEEIDARTLLADDAFDMSGKSPAAQHWFALEHPDAIPGGAPHARHGHDGSHHAHDVNRHGDDIRAFALVFDEPLDWTMFGIWLTMLLNRHGAEVLRVKGILNVAGSPTPVAVHGVQHLVHAPRHMPAWPSEDRRSRIVFIMKGLDPASVTRSLRAFAALASPERLSSVRIAEPA